MDTVNVFVSYSHQNAEWVDLSNRGSLISRLSQLLHNDVKFWCDHELSTDGGVDYKEKIRDEINRADIAVLLISQDFLASDFIQEYELPWIKERFDRKELAVVPILVGHADLAADKSLNWITDRQIIPSSTTPLIEIVRDPAEWDRVVVKQILGTFRRRIDEIRATAPAGVKQDLRKVVGKPRTVHAPRASAPSRRFVLYPALVLAVLVCAFFGYQWVSGREYVTRRDSLLGAMPWLNWLVYDPVDYNPYKNTMPSEASIRTDLEVLRRSGFDGLITMTSRDACRHIPRIAQEVGFNMVIVGVWNPRDGDEVADALSIAEYADAYCIGHKGLNKQYSEGELRQLMLQFRRKAHRPVTTSEVIADYKTNPSLVDMGDFLFPDVHAHWHKGMSPQAVWEETLKMAKLAEKLAASERKLVLLKMVSYPSGGLTGISPSAQREFYRLAVEDARERTDLSGRVSFSYLCAFDPTWKTAEFGWHRPEQFTGLFTADRKPKPAVTGVDWKSKHQ